MTEFDFNIKYDISLWEYLKNTDKPIFLYGMGDGADKIMSALSRLGKKPTGIFASDDFARGHSFRGYNVTKLSEVEARYDDFIILLAFGTFREPLYTYLTELSKRHEMYAPDLPVILDGGADGENPVADFEIFDLDYLNRHAEQINSVYNMLEDELSRRVFEDIINFKISGNISDVTGCVTDKQEVYDSIIKPKSGEVYLDLGAYNGDTAEEYLNQVGDSAKLVIAVEPDAKNFIKLVNNTQKYGSEIKCVNKGIWKHHDMLKFYKKAGRNSLLGKSGDTEIEVVSADEIIGELNCKADIIKYDVEGSEYNAILGSKRAIERYRPRLMVSAYHRNRDIFELPLLIKSINPDYKVYFRHQKYIPAWECNFYFV